MKNIILAAIVVIFTGILSSCVKRTNVQTNSVAFPSSLFTAKATLATAD